INMVFGAAAAGKRAMTSSSGPGISLKQEGISTLAGAEMPCVIVNMTRGGPGLGNIAPAQSDYFQATKGGGHGDYHCIVLAPSTIQELVDFMFEAFPLAEKWRLPVMILGDGALGQMMEPVDFRGRERLADSRKQPEWALTGAKGRKPHLVKSLFLHGDDLYHFNLRQQEKWEKIQAEEPKLELVAMEDADYAIAAFGSMGRIAGSVIDLARAEGIKLGLIRPLTLWPFPNKAIAELVGDGTLLQRILTVEMNLGQMVEDVRLAVNGKIPVDFFGSPGGRVPMPEEVLAELHKIIG
ncbi:MAG TPA: 3-methyl-2-oxobutanoate dehydrogenase subunit VorB, partial [bacterium]|nr:3-methyl-2-oxobutanoate dehydrogenase subunit VorB [bacterium]